MGEILNKPSGAGDGAPPVGERSRTPQEADYLEAKKEALRRGDALAEFREGRNIDPGEVWIVLSNEFLFPSEIAGIPVSPYESGPILRECLRRSGASDTVLALQDRATELEKEIHRAEEQFEAQVTGTEEERKAKEILGRQFAVLARRLYGGPEIQLDDGKRVKGEHGLLDRLRKKVEEGGTPEDKQEWRDIYWRLTGSLTLLDIHKQREGALGSIETYCGQLFESGFYKHEIGMREFLALLKDPLYGSAIEEGLRVYTEIHLGKIEERVRVKFGEFGSDSSQFDMALEKYLISTGEVESDGTINKGKIGPDGTRNKSFALPRPLQIEMNGDIPAREIVDAYVGEKVARIGGKHRPYVTERAVIIAKRIAEFGQLTTWLSFPRDSDGEVIRKKDGSFPKEGCGRLEGKTSTDLAKFYIGKWENERRAGKPSGVKPWKWEMVPFETFSKDIFHQEVVIMTNWYDKDGKLINILNLPQNGGLKERKVPIFDLWYKGYTDPNFGYTGEKHSLLEIMEGVDLGKRGDLRPIKYVKFENGREISVTVNASPRERIEPLPENFFDSYHFAMYKQGKAREIALLQGMPGTRDDCISPLMTPRDLQQMNKDLGTALGNDVIKNWFKVNLIVTRVLDYLDKKGEEGKSESEGEIGVSKHRYVGDDAKRVGRAIGDTHIDYILAQARVDSGTPEVPGTSFLSNELIELCRKRIGKRMGMISIGEFTEEMYNAIRTSQDQRKKTYFRNALVDFYRLSRPLLGEDQRARIDRVIDSISRVA